MKRTIKSFKNFYTRNKTLSFFLAASVLTITKFSDAPFLDFLPNFLRILFTKPGQNTDDFYLFEVLNSLSMAYITSLFFYLIVEYIPQIRKEEKAKTILLDNLVHIFISLDELIHIFLLNIGVYKDCSQIEEKQISNIEVMRLKEIIYFKRKQFNNSYVYDFFQPEYDILRTIISLRKTIQKLKETPVSMNLSFEILSIISDIENNRFLIQAENIVKEGDVSEEGLKITRSHLLENYIKLIKSIIELKRSINYIYEFERHPIEIHEKDLYLKILEDKKTFVKNIDIEAYSKAYIGGNRIL